MRVLRIIASVDPKGGGPVEASLATSQVLQTRHGAKLRYLSLDTPGAPYLDGFPFPITATGPAPPKGLPSRRFRAAARQMAGEADVAIVHGLWNEASIGAYSALRTVHTPYVLFPHGMLDPYFWASNPLKGRLKQLYWSALQGRVARDAHRLLFTSEAEAELAKQSVTGHRWTPRVVKYCSADQAAQPEDEKAKLPWPDGPYLLFLSRLHSKKGCKELLHAYAAFAGNKTPPFALVMAGPGADSYVQELKKLAADLGIADHVHWPGMLRGRQKRRAFALAEAFVLPSYQENFGLVVAEALSASCLPIISRHVNIWPKIAEDNACLMLDMEDITASLLHLAAMPTTEKQAMKQRGRATYLSNFGVEAAAEDLHDALNEAIAAQRR